LSFLLLLFPSFFDWFSDFSVGISEDVDGATSVASGFDLDLDMAGRMRWEEKKTEKSWLPTEKSIDLSSLCLSSPLLSLPLNDELE